jgi:hypothetical protein
MAHSIQDYFKKINSQVRLEYIVSLVVLLVFLIPLTFILHTKREISHPEAVFIKRQVEVIDDVSLAKPFGSKNGTTYTYSWCLGSGRILEKNKIFFLSQEDAEKRGRTLAKTCM